MRAMTTRDASRATRATRARTTPETTPETTIRTTFALASRTSDRASARDAALDRARATRTVETADADIRTFGRIAIGGRFTISTH